MMRSKFVKSSDEAVENDENQHQEILPRDFNGQLYLEINTDVRDAGVDPAVHYVYEGLKEGRAYKYEQ